MKKAKKISRKGLVKKIDKIFSKIIVARDKKCVICGSKKQLGNGHVFSRRSYSTRWSPSNCFAQCWSCNYGHKYDYYPYSRWFIKKYTLEAYDVLYKYFKKKVKFTDESLEELLNRFEKQYEKGITNTKGSTNKKPIQKKDEKSKQRKKAKRT